MNTIDVGVHRITDWYRCVELDIDADRIDEVAVQSAFSEWPIADWRRVIPASLQVEGHFQDAIDFLFCLISIDFRHWDLYNTTQPYSTKPFFASYRGEERTGSGAMELLMKKAVDDGIPLFSAEYMANLTVDDAYSIFMGLDSDGEPMAIPAIKERVAILNEVGTILCEKYDGSFLTLLEKSQGYAFNDGNGIVELLVRDFSRYRDIYTVDGRQVPVLKLAQLMVQALHCAFGHDGTIRIHDLDRLTVCLDYQLPRHLRHLRMLSYHGSLAYAVDNEILIERNSRQEMDIRIGSLIVAERLQDAINHLRDSRGLPAITSLEIDYFLWNWKEKGDFSFTKHHLTKTIMY